jgi:hypothetical protein
MVVRGLRVDFTRFGTIPAQKHQQQFNRYIPVNHALTTSVETPLANVAGAADADANEAFCPSALIGTLTLNCDPNRSMRSLPKD